VERRVEGEVLGDEEGVLIILAAAPCEGAQGAQRSGGMAAAVEVH
jgi:hypothetical protein